MYFLYNIAVYIVSFSLRFVAIFNKKIALFVNGRKNVFKELTSKALSGEVIWFHCASLGEFEQGRPIIEKLKSQNPTIKILVTFFSPSGYEVRKEYAYADVVCYLPLDTQSNARKFIELVNPRTAVFVKYEFWPNLLRELKRANIKTVLVSGIFRKDQSFFKRHGSWMRKSLKTFDHFFVQNVSSKDLLHNIGLKNITVSGDTRFDRVSDILKQENSIKEINDFANKKHVLVAGSTWPQDEALLIDYINNHATEDEKFIIAPHTINSNEIDGLMSSLKKKTVLFSKIEELRSGSDAHVLIIDSIGILTKVYSYATIAYVGGGFKTGLHNVLEPAVFGVPIVIGPNFEKFNEAKELVKLEACVVVHNQEQFTNTLKNFQQHKELLEEKGAIAGNYVEENTGATNKILSYLLKN